MRCGAVHLGEGGTMRSNAAADVTTFGVDTSLFGEAPKMASAEPSARSTTSLLRANIETR